MERISKLLAQRGICSRREADRYIEAGQVLVNGEVAVLGQKAESSALIELMDQAKRIQKNKLTIALHKPVGIVSTQPEKDYQEAIDLITAENQFESDGKRLNLRGLSVVGRLDIESKGLLIFTQDGTLARELIGPDSNVEKEYLVRVDGEITEKKLKMLRFGLMLDGKQLKRANVSVLEEGLLKFVLREGKNRQIRRMCELVDLYVTSLKRVRIGNFRLGDLPMGKWRVIQQGEARHRAKSKGQWK